MAFASFRLYTYVGMKESLVSDGKTSLSMNFHTFIIAIGSSLSK